MTVIHANAVLLAALLGVGFAQDPTEPRPLPGNAFPDYPNPAQQLAVAGTVSFRATVSSEGEVTSVHVLYVPGQNVGFEEATKRAVFN